MNTLKAFILTAMLGIAIISNGLAQEVPSLADLKNTKEIKISKLFRVNDGSALRKFDKVDDAQIKGQIKSAESTEVASEVKQDILDSIADIAEASYERPCLFRPRFFFYVTNKIGSEAKFYEIRICDSCKEISVRYVKSDDVGADFSFAPEKYKRVSYKTIDKIVKFIAEAK